MNLWKFVSFLVTISMSSFVFGQSCLTFRDKSITLPDIIVFPPFIFGIGACLLASLLSIHYGIKQKLLVKVAVIILGFLTVFSLLQGHYNSTLAIREAIFSPYGIGTWIAFLFALPATNKFFWHYFREHLLIMFKFVLVLELIAIILLLSNNEGLLRVNFSTSIALFILIWGILSSDKSLFRWGLFGLLLFELHSFILDQRETFLLPFEFLIFFIPVYFAKAFTRKTEIFGKIFKVISFIYIGSIVLTIAYLTLPAGYRKAATSTNITNETRLVVVDDYLKSEMSHVRYYILGKGVNGFYKSKLRSNSIGGRGTSLGIEVGYLQMVLNVGLIYVVIMILLSLLQAIKCILHSQNPLAIASSLWVLVRLLNMIVAARPSTDLGWFLFWICIGILNSTEMLTNTEINQKATEKGI